jgi:predicted nucleotidyltransferase
MAKTTTTKQAEEKVKNFVSFLQTKYNLPIDNVYLFGSYAKNKQNLWSDIDVCIVSPKFKKGDSLSYLWQKRRIEDIKNMIAPVGYSVDDFNSTNLSPLVNEIKKFGRQIY